MGQVVQVLGSLLVLGGFVLGQARLLDQKSLGYLWLNAVGSAILAANACLGRQWGFLLLEGVWAIVSAASLIDVVRKRRTAAVAPRG